MAIEGIIFLFGYIIIGSIVGNVVYKILNKFKDNDIVVEESDITAIFLGVFWPVIPILLLIIGITIVIDYLINKIWK